GHLPLRRFAEVASERRSEMARRAGGRGTCPLSRHGRAAETPRVGGRAPSQGTALPELSAMACAVHAVSRAYATLLRRYTCLSGDVHSFRRLPLFPIVAHKQFA